ncbi:MAG: hypothetical protein HC817_09670 [Saprospiraceae bacterium]|nr:hypothetical protein [Saprospiraceae bacterium]
MKRLLFMAFFAFLGGSCGKTVEGFDMSYRRQFNIDIGLNTFLSHNFKFNDILPDTAAFFQLNNSNSSQVTRIEPRAMSFRALFSSNAVPYSFINRLEVFISDPSRPNLPEQVIFYRDDVPLNAGNQIDLVPNNVDVRPYIFEGKKFSIRVNIQLRETPQRSIETQWDASFLP